MLLPLLSIESEQVERGPGLERKMSTTLFAFGTNLSTLYECIKQAGHRVAA